MRKYLSIVMVCILLLMSSATVFAKNVELRYWTVQGEEEIEHLKPYFKEFEEANPGVKITIQRFPGWTDFWTKTLTAIAAGAGPDIVMLKEYMVFDLASRGALVNLSSYIDADPTINQEDFVPATWEAVLYPHGGSPHALPLYCDALTTFYNRDLFTEVGLDPDMPPETWDDLKEYAIKLTDPQKHQYGWQWYELGTREACLAWWLAFYWQAGGEFWVPGKEGVEVSLNNQAGLDALNLQLDTIYKDKSALPPSVTATQMVETGKIGMWMTGPFAYKNYAAYAPDLNYSTALLPKYKTQAHNALVDTLAIIKDSKHQDLAYSLVSHLRSERVDYEWASNPNVGWLPVRTANLKKPPMTTDNKWIVQAEAFFLPETKPKPVAEGYDGMAVKIATALQSAWFGKTTPEEALAMAERDANAFLKEIHEDK